MDGFGQVNRGIYTALNDYAILKSNTTLYYVRSSELTSQVRWSYIDSAGTRSDLTGTTDTLSGFSTLQILSFHPGYYSCEISEDGVTTTFTVLLANTDPGMFVAAEIS